MSGSGDGGRGPEPETAAVVETLSRGAAWLLRARDPEGWWKDFDDPPVGLSDEWTTAYVGTALGRLHPEAAEATWRPLRDRQPPEGGWCFNRRFGIADADSTAWALQLAGVVGDGNSRAAERARRFLERHVRPDGGIATFSQYPVEATGWTASHECVTAAVGALPKFLPRGSAGSCGRDR